jgi:UDPglucose--hexose-1-phosphate uridylyltransferase
MTRADLDLTSTTHRRHNPLTGDWVLVSPHRTNRPWQGQTETSSVAPAPAHDPNCYLCPGNTRVNGVTNPNYTSIFVFDNDFPALLPYCPPAKLHVNGRPAALGVGGPPAALDVSGPPSALDVGGPPAALEVGGLLTALSESGTCRVICYSPLHNFSLGELPLWTIRQVIDAWSLEYQVQGAPPRINAVTIFENRGAMMGASNPHPHGQIWSNETLPDAMLKESTQQSRYLNQRGSCLLCDYAALETTRAERVVCANEHFVAVVPFWAAWPFETLVLPRTHVASLDVLDSAARDGFAQLLKDLTGRYDRLFNVPFPYTMGLHQQPTDHRNHPEWHLHAHFYPPLLRSATIRKFMVGYEMLAGPQRDITPELAAAHLRDINL